MPVDYALIATLVVALLFDFMNGYMASASLVATIIASGAMSPRPALLLAAVAEFIGPLILGVSVAGTIGRDLVDTAQLPLSAVLAMALGAVLWLLLTYRLGLPVSPSHALVGGIVGAAIAAGGVQSVQIAGLTKVVAGLLAAPLIGFASGWLFMNLLLFLVRGASPRVNGHFKLLQVPASFGLALTQGSNDAQKTIGLITMALVISGQQTSFYVSEWVVVLSAAVIALGVGLGGQRTIRTVASKFYRVRPIHGFTTQTVSGTVVLTSSLLGAPVSAGQVVSSTLVGVGSAERMSKIRWNMAANIAVAWLLTIPAAALFGAGVYLVLSVVF
jgi:inorganic phosphate transporter, PiT family